MKVILVARFDMNDHSRSIRRSTVSLGNANAHCRINVTVTQATAPGQDRLPAYNLTTGGGGEFP